MLIKRWSQPTFRCHIKSLFKIMFEKFKSVFNTQKIDIKKSNYLVKQLIVLLNISKA